jgi:hypothetical protein
VWRIGVSVLAAAYLGVVSTYHLAVQRGYAAAWAGQRAFWTEVLQVAPDLQDGTVLFFQRDEPDETHYIQTNSWADPLVLDMLFEFPSSWQLQPRLFTSEGDSWKQRVEQDGAGLKWWVPGASWNEHYEPLPSGNVIVLDRIGGKLTRLPGPIEVAGRSLALKPVGPSTIQEAPRQRVYEFLIGR